MDNPDEKQKHSFNPVRGPTPRPIRAYELSASTKVPLLFGKRFRK